MLNDDEMRTTAIFFMTAMMADYIHRTCIRNNDLYPKYLMDDKMLCNVNDLVNDDVSDL